MIYWGFHIEMSDRKTVVYIKNCTGTEKFYKKNQIKPSPRAICEIDCMDTAAVLFPYILMQWLVVRYSAR